MLEGTVNNIKDLIAKLQVAENVLAGLNRTHVDDKEQAEKILKRVSKRKLIWMEEVLRLIDVPELSS